MVQVELLNVEGKKGEKIEIPVGVCVCEDFHNDEMGYMLFRGQCDEAEWEALLREIKIKGFVDAGPADKERCTGIIIDRREEV